MQDSPLKTHERAVLEMPSSIGIYIHFPWCLAKCPYCDFLSLAEPDPTRIPDQEYTDVVVRELEARAPLANGRPVHSVFFGGGTPSLWSGRGVARVVETLFDKYSLNPEVEITLEANPSSLTLDKARQFRAAGINRLSVGVQSLDDEQLRFLGRLHQSEGALTALEYALSAGFTNLSADLIYGVYRQPPEKASAEVKHIAQSGVTHLSAYMLTIEPGTRFGALHRKGQLPLLEDTLVGASFAAVHDTLAECGLQHYEISNFALPGRESRHNLGYWRGEPYLGIGLGAFGTLPPTSNNPTPVRYRNTAQVDRYLKLTAWPYPTLAHAGSMGTYHQVEALDAPTQLVERLMLGLRLREGVNAHELARQFGPSFEQRKRAIAELTKLGKLELTADGRLRIPYAHWLFADGIIACLV
jgi:putative oxygen-independent coproporphyrinogen III oxidase